jgi:hypothetical protein
MKNRHYRIARLAELAPVTSGNPVPTILSPVSQGVMRLSQLEPKSAVWVQLQTKRLKAISDVSNMKA